MSQSKLFKTKLVPAKEGSDRLFDEEIVGSNRSVTCLGLEFENDKARREYFTQLLRERLRNPEFRKIEGFPLGEDKDILSLSDPPYYTACPNPWISEFIEEWESEKPEQPEGYLYQREPFAADVSEGKNDPIYNAHSYHTKVPHKAIMRYILHYTEPGDIIFDGFCGTGMTGVAAQMCGDKKVVESLGYQVKSDGTIYQEEVDGYGRTKRIPFSKLGARKAVLNDLSPAATFIAYNYNTPVAVHEFEREAKRILEEVEQEYGWMYETIHTDGVTKGKINYTVWSDVFVCPECSSEVVFWEAAVDKKAGKVRDTFPCPHCQAELTKRRMERAWSTKYDSAIQKTIRQAKQVPVLINYSVEGVRGRFEKKPEQYDLALIEKIKNSEIPYWFPTNRMMEGKESRRNDPAGITHVHHFYTKRNLWVLGALRSNANQINLPSLQYWLNSLDHGLGKRVKHGNYSFPMSILSGTLYIPSMGRENNPLYFYTTRYKKHIKVLSSTLAQSNPISCQSTEYLNASDNSLDYIFLDPPFGANLMYSELNFLWESWLKVWTNNKQEAIENKVQGKGLTEYRELMTACFKEAYRVLKPGRWMTVEFSNTKASVWNSIQTALADVGFIIANVSALDKKQGSFKAVTTTTAVKQDLVISVYKPQCEFEERFKEEAITEDGVWDFVRTHLRYLPVVKTHGPVLQFVPERDPRILFDQVIAYYVRKGFSVPIDSQDFQVGLAQRFIERDGMYFLPDQVAQYDKKKMQSGEVMQAALFVSDEASAIGWLRQLLKERPQTFQDINPKFMQQLGGWSRNEAQLDLRELLNQNFLCFDGKGRVPEQIHSYLSTNWKDMRNLSKDDPLLKDKAKDRWYVPDPNKIGDLEKLREKALLKEFEEYKALKKKLKVFRLEAVRAGFKKAYQEHDYEVIISIAEKIPGKVLEEDPKLLMWYDQAVTRLG